MINAEDQFLAGVYTPEFLQSTDNSDENDNTTVVPIVDSATSTEEKATTNKVTLFTM